jgi:hypothetical protein
VEDFNGFRLKVVKAVPKEADRIPLPVPTEVPQNENPEPSDRFCEGKWDPPKHSCFLFSCPLDWTKRDGWNLEAKYKPCGGLEGGSDDGRMKAILGAKPQGLKRFRTQGNKAEVAAEFEATKQRLKVICFFILFILGAEVLVKFI